MSLPAPYLPVEVTDAQMAFPASVLGPLMPAEEDIPEEFWGTHNPWACIASSWFMHGLPANVEFHMKDGIDGQTAFDHLRCILGSYEPKHQHKIAAVAFLLSTWCTEVKNWKEAS